MKKVRHQDPEREGAFSQAPGNYEPFRERSCAREQAPSIVSNKVGFGLG